MSRVCLSYPLACWINCCLQECLIVAPSDAGSKLVEVGASQATITPRPTQIEVQVWRYQGQLLVHRGLATQARDMQVAWIVQ